MSKRVNASQHFHTTIGADFVRAMNKIEKFRNTNQWPNQSGGPSSNLRSTTRHLHVSVLYSFHPTNRGHMASRWSDVCVGWFRSKYCANLGDTRTVSAKMPSQYL